EHNTGGLFTSNGVRDGSLNAGNLEGVLLCLFDTLCDCRGNFFRLAVADTNGTVAVANNYKSGEAEPTSTLNYLGDAVDRDDAFDVLVIATASVATTAVPAAIATVTPFASCAGALIGAARRALGPTTLRCSHQTILCCRSNVEIFIITASTRLRVRLRLPRPRDRGSGYRRDRIRPRRSRRPLRAGQLFRPPCEPSRSYRRQGYAGRLRVWKPTPA